MARRSFLKGLAAIVFLISYFYLGTLRKPVDCGDEGETQTVHLARHISTDKLSSQPQYVGAFGDYYNRTRGNAQQLEGLYGLLGNFSWLHHTESLDAENLLPLTKEVQRAISEHQNPPLHSCSLKKFVVGGSLEGQGLGSVIHIAGFWLAAAMEHDRILIWHTTQGGSIFVDEGCGTGEEYSNLDCLFEKISTCGPQHVTEANSITPYAWGPTEEMPLLNSWEVPSMFTQMMQDSYPHIAFSVDGLKYWWRAQATAYIARMNARTREVLGRLRLDPSMHNAFVRIDDKVQKLNMPFPLPPGTIDMHVRHGDKGAEMRLVPFRDYVLAAETFVNQNPLFFRKIMLVTTESPDVVKEAHNIRRLIYDEGTPDGEWVVFSSNTYRDNTSPFQQLERFGRQNTTYHWLLTITMALECDMWIGTRASNWNRIIDEVRCTWIAKCKQPYIEVGDKASWKTYWW